MEQWDSMLKELDKDGNGMIDILEFRNLFKKAMDQRRGSQEF